MGAVYEAVDESTGARVALKVIHGGVSGSTGDEMSRKGRFVREARAAAAIDSPHVARVLDFGTGEGGESPFMVMELLGGEDLQRVFKRVDVLPPDVAVRIAAQVCEGLVKAHEARVIHRDIKPANLILAQRPDGGLEVKILDFGIAKIRPELEHGSETTGLTSAGSMLGSPLYMSPEQARGSAKLDFRTDLWSLGVVLYRALTGRLPHEKTDGLGDFLVVLCSEDPRPVQELSPWISPELATVVTRALQINTDRRFASAAEMLAALQALLPQGDRLLPGMIAPLAPNARALTAPRMSIAPPPPGPDGISTVTAAAHTSATQTVPTPTRVASRGLVVAAGLVLVAAGVLGVLRVAAPRSGTGAGAEVPSAPASSPQASTDRAVTVVILPSDATVEIGGAAVPVRDGIIELRGPLGSIHSVMLSRGAQKAKVHVVIAESGAMPPKVELPPIPEEKVAPSASAVKPQVAPPAWPRTPPTPSATPSAKAKPRKDPLIPERFE